MNTKANKRIQWIDAAKFIGIYCIWLGHMCEHAGLAYPFVYVFHVPLFFFLSGCVESFNHKDLSNSIKKKTLNILLPFVVGAIVSIVYYYFKLNSVWGIRRNLLMLVYGYPRNYVPIAGSLWFLSCLYIMEIAFEFLKRIKYKNVVLIILCALCIFANSYIQPPKGWPWNIDNMICYFPFYVGGYLIFPYIEKLIERTKSSIVAKIGFWVSGVACLLYCALCYFNYDVLSPVWKSCWVLGYFKAFIFFWAIIFMAASVKWGEVLQEAGRNTLYLCLSEYIVKDIVPDAFSMIGLCFEPKNPAITGIYIMALLLFTSRYLVPFERKAILEVSNKISHIMRLSI